jgi:hypothetical protein
LFTRLLRPSSSFGFVHILRLWDLGCRARLVRRFESAAIGDGGSSSCSIFWNGNLLEKQNAAYGFESDIDSDEGDSDSFKVMTVIVLKVID